MREDKVLAMLAPKKTGVSLFQLAGNINSRFYVHGCTGTQGACSTLKGKHKNHHHQTRSDQLMDYYYKNGGFLDSRNVFDEMKSWDLMSLELNHNCDCAA
uniref:Uncharacterized protein n=1 Tax=Arundo donax TaxID=35708 RepID=A0A0A9E5T9_ARUDO